MHQSARENWKWRLGNLRRGQETGWRSKLRHPAEKRATSQSAQPFSAVISSQKALLPEFPPYRAQAQKGKCRFNKALV